MHGPSRLSERPKATDPAAKAAVAKAIRSAITAEDINVDEGLQMISKLGDVDSAFTRAGTILVPRDPRYLLAKRRKFLFRSREPKVRPLPGQLQPKVAKR